MLSCEIFTVALGNVRPLSGALLLDMLKAALIRQDSGRLERVLPTVKDGRTGSIMTHAPHMTPEVALATAQEFAENAQTLTRTALALAEVAEFLAEAGGVFFASAAETAPTSPVPAGVVDFAAYRSRRQAVQR